MAECRHSSYGSVDLYSSIGDQLEEITRKCRSIKGPLTRYILETKTVMDGDRFKRETFGEEDKSKPHKTVLLVGETGTGKSTLINAFLNYMLDVKEDYKIWCEIIETKANQDKSQTKTVNVYDIYTDKSPFSLTVIDTPGYGSTEGRFANDLKIAESLHKLFMSKDGVHQIDAVCLVVSSSTNRLTENQLYVFDAILSLFGFDVERNIVLLITNVQGKPTNALNAVKASKVKCAKTRKGMPKHFCFNNSHCENLCAATADEEEEDDDDDDDDDEEEEEETKTHTYKYLWVKNEKTMNLFFDFLNGVSPINIKLTESVLRKRKQLTASIANLKYRITLIELRTTELEQTKAALEKCEKEKKDNNDFEYEVDEPYKEKVPIDSEWWHLTREATCCNVCKENCHYPGCWWVRDLSWCSVMSGGKCTVCTGRCDYTEHVKEGKIYELKTRKVKKTFEDLKRRYEEESGETISLMARLENEIKMYEREKHELVDESYQCVISLDEIALNQTAVSTLQHLDFLIDKMKVTANTERIQKLQEIKKRHVNENHMW